MAESDKLIYESEKHGRNLWQSYIVYSDRIELNFPFGLGTITIPKDQIAAVDLFKPPVMRTSITALKLDLADLYTHVGIVRTKGFFKEIRFTPDQPEVFLQAARSLLA